MEKHTTVRAVFSSFTGDARAERFVLVTSAVPPNYVCHSCAPTIGMAVFSQKGSNWTMDAFNRAVTYAGSWGQPPEDIQLVQVGQTALPWNSEMWAVGRVRPRRCWNS